MTGHVNLPPACPGPDPPRARRGHLQPEGDGLRATSPGFPAKLEPGRQDRHGHQPRGRRAQQLVRGLRAQPQPAVRGAGRDRPGWVRRRGGRAVGAQHLRLPRDQPDRRREDAHPSSPPTAALPASNPPFGTPTTTDHRPGAATRTTRPPRRPPRRPRRRPRRRRPGGSGPVGLGAPWRLFGHRWNDCSSASPSRRATSVVSRGPSTPSTVRARWPGCSSTPTPTRSGSPTRGCRSSTRSSTSAPMPSPSGPTPPGWTWRRPCAAAGVPLFSVEQHVAARDFDVLAFNLSAELVYTNVLNLIDLAAVPAPRGRPGARGPLGDRRAATAPSIPSHWRTSSTPSPWATGRRSSGRSTRPSAAGWPCRWASATARSCAWPWPGSRGSTSPPSTPRPTATGAWSSTLPNRPGVPAEVAKRTVTDLADWPYPARPLVPLTEVVHDRLNVEVFRGCTRGCRFCQAGMITRPVRERPAEQVKEMVQPGTGLERPRRGHPDLALDGGLLGHRGHRARHHRRPGPRGAGLGQPARRCGWTPSRWGRRRRSRRCAGPVSPSPPRAGPGACAR